MPDFYETERQERERLVEIATEIIEGGGYRYADAHKLAHGYLTERLNVTALENQLEKLRADMDHLESDLRHAR